MCWASRCSETSVLGVGAPTKSSDEVDKQSAGCPASSEGSGIHDNPDYIAPNQADLMLMDVTSEKLHGEISENLGVTYLSKVTSAEHQAAPLVGQLCGLNGRLMVNVETRRMSRRRSGIQCPHLSVIFLCDTGAPST